MYAYEVELILAKEKLRGDPKSCTFLVSPDDVAYSFGHLTRNGEEITDSDLPDLKAAYEKWWNLNKGKTLEELRKEWRNGKKPLKGSEFSWG